MERVRVASFFAISGMASAWITILVSILINPWFRVTGNALSDLGGGNQILNGHPSPNMPFVYNDGMILTAILIILFSAIMITATVRKMEITGESFFIISGLFLALIGIYHEGTYPHNFVSIWFFILASLSYAVIGVSMISTELNKFGIVIIVVIVSSWIAYWLVPWGSVAENEIFGIVIIGILVGIHVMSRWSSKKQ